MHQPLRRLPWTDEGRPAYVPVGDGMVNRIADAMELEILAGALRDAGRAEDLVRAVETSLAELRTAVKWLAHALRDAVDVAVLRGERLGVEEGKPLEVPSTSAGPGLVGQSIQVMLGADGAGR
ncbi:hypothetical protein SRB5_13860 [Streptomyces sp. RB5]|uniref:Uncharacterized protein n=1 Tax=Streptomyces smaragdinus TaxID=2585196 RepID=A0A7K0CCU1_9ACTN|nr:hypothetical protein [Streptomyces smaragdinus]MQY11271.1 hypothetical protein [Streptomyces smaragdinus]